MSVNERVAGRARELYRVAEDCQASCRISAWGQVTGSSKWNRRGMLHRNGHEDQTRLMPALRMALPRLDLLRTVPPDDRPDD